jgi:hypothetical protein
MMNQGSPYALLHPLWQTASRAEIPPRSSNHARTSKNAIITTATLKAAKGVLLGIMAIMATSCTNNDVECPNHSCVGGQYYPTSDVHVQLG